MRARSWSHAPVPFGLEAAAETELLSWCSKLREACVAAGCLILVEGKRDRIALSALVGSHNIETINTGRTIEQRVAELAAKATVLIVLTDYDDKGYQLDRHLNRYARAHDLRLEFEPKQRLKQITGGRVRHLEDLRRWLERITADESELLKD